MELRVNDASIDADAIAREAQLHSNAADPQRTARRSLAVRELLLQRAAQLGLMDRGAGVASASRDEEDALIAKVLDEEVKTPSPTEDECRRFHAAHPERFSSGELVEARHILFAVTAGTPVMALRQRAEAALEELRKAPALFAERARQLSNCPSSVCGGSLGQFGRGAMVPEFDRELFGTRAVGILPELVTTRHGFHVVEVVRRVAGKPVPFEAIAGHVAALLAAQVEVHALRQYVEVLAGHAVLAGVDLGAAGTPLVQ